MEKKTIILTAAEAKLSAKLHKNLLDLQGKIVEKIKVGGIKDVWNTIIEAIKRGENRCVAYYIPAGLQSILMANKYKIETETEGTEGPRYFTISWDDVL